VIVWQAWAFFIPAFDEGHARLMKGFVALSVGLLVVGVVFGYYVALPAATTFLTSYDESHYDILIRARDYISFATKVLVAMGVVFQLPLFVVGLTRLGIISTARLRRERRVGYFAVACIAVALPGVDPVTTIFEMVPLIVLYELSIWLSVLLDRRSAEARAKTAAGVQ
jgi:sec-independent protein translocase protein TatC